MLVLSVEVVGVPGTYVDSGIISVMTIDADALRMEVANQSPNWLNQQSRRETQSTHRGCRHNAALRAWHSGFKL
jgi:hypothetical protein